MQMLYEDGRGADGLLVNLSMVAHRSKCDALRVTGRRYLSAPLRLRLGRP
jgi:hypothetical protein